MRILHVATRFVRGGAERNVAQLMAWQAEDGNSVDLVVGAVGDGSLMPPSAGQIVLPALVREVRPHLDLKAVRALRTIVRSGRYDLVHTHQAKAGIVGRLAAQGGAASIVHTVHASTFGPDHSRAVSAAYRWIELYCAARTDVIVCVGNGLREEFIRAGVGDPRRYLVIRSPLDVDAFARVRQTTTLERTGILADLGVPGDLPILLAVGALEPRKRTAWLVQTLQGLLSSRRARLVVAGDGPERKAIEALVANRGLDTVHLLGHVSDVPKVLAVSRVLVHAWRAEGVSQVVIQALLAGVPVVATEVAGLREVPDAPIWEVPTSGAGFVEAVEAAIVSSGSHVPLHAFDSWRPRPSDWDIGS